MLRWKPILTVLLVLVLGAGLMGCPPAVTVPDVVGLTQSAAESAITGAGLTVGAVTQEYHATVPVGQVINQNPAGNASATQGSPVTLIVSMGPNPDGPTAGFGADTTSGVAPLTVQFTDTSTEGSSSITAWAWDFDGDDTTDSTEQDPEVTYVDPGVYDVSLTVTTADGTDTEEKTGYITVEEGDGGDDVTPGEMVSIAAGSFEMGDAFIEGYSWELPVHTVMLSAYEIGKYEVTNQEYADILNWANGQGYLTTASTSTASAYGEELLDVDDSNCQITWNGSQFVVDTRDGYSMADHPVVEVSWYGAVVYCNWLSLRQGLQACYNTSTWACDFTKNGYHLPTEAQWERAAAWNGSSHLRYGNGSDSISTSTANYSDGGYANPLALTSFPYTAPLGYYAGVSSPAGCYDMSGNVWEWCNDWYGTSYYSSSPGTDPEGPSLGSERVLRGGSWNNDDTRCRSAHRDSYNPSYTFGNGGFRLSR